MSIPTSMTIRWGIAAGAAVILFALLFASGRLLIDVSGQAPQASECRNGTTVPNPTTNALLVGDCDVLWSLKDTLRGTATLNWAANRQIEGGWEGVTVSGTPKRVRRIQFYGLTFPSRQAGQELNGTLPPALGQLSALTSLTLNEQELTGSIPKELGNITTLQYLVFENSDTTTNKLSGEIPSELGNLSNLIQLSLVRHTLTGEIPSELGNLSSNLTHLLLGRNRLTGSIPSELGNLSGLTQMNLGHNRLTGSIPSELGNLSNLTQLVLTTNMLTGEIPSELGDLSNLTHLLLAENMLSGEIPSEIGGISGLVTLYLGNNLLTGEFPLWVGGMSSLQNFGIQQNPMTGAHLPPDNIFNPTTTNVIVGRRTEHDPPGRPERMIGCIPSYMVAWNAITGALGATYGEDRAGRFRGDWEIPLLRCASNTPSRSSWWLDTILSSSDPVLGGEDVMRTLTLSADYTIPNSYVTSTTTPNRVQFRSLSTTVSTGGSLTVTIARKGESAAPTLVGFDTRTSGTGAPTSSQLSTTRTISASDISCTSASSTETTVTSEGVMETRHVPPDPIQTLCTSPAQNIWFLSGSHAESPYEISVTVASGSVVLTSVLNSANSVASTVGGTNWKTDRSWATVEVSAQQPTPTPTPVPPTATPTPEPPTATPTPEPPTATPTPDPAAPPTSTPTPDPAVPPTSTPTPDPDAPPTSTPTSTPTPDPDAPPTSTPTPDPDATSTPTPDPDAPPTATPTPGSGPPPPPGGVSPPPPSGVSPPPPPAGGGSPQPTSEATAIPTATATATTPSLPRAGTYDIPPVILTPSATPTVTPTRTPVPTATSTATATATPIPPDDLPSAGGTGVSGGLLLMLFLAGGLLLAAGSALLRTRAAQEETP